MRTLLILFLLSAYISMKELTTQSHIDFDTEISFNKSNYSFTFNNED